MRYEYTMVLLIIRKNFLGELKWIEPLKSWHTLWFYSQLVDRELFHTAIDEELRSPEYKRYLKIFHGTGGIVDDLQKKDLPFWQGGKALRKVYFSIIRNTGWGRVRPDLQTTQ